MSPVLIHSSLGLTTTTTISDTRREGEREKRRPERKEKNYRLSLSQRKHTRTDITYGDLFHVSFSSSSRLPSTLSLVVLSLRGTMHRRRNATLHVSSVERQYILTLSLTLKGTNNKLGRPGALRSRIEIDPPQNARLTLSISCNTPETQFRPQGVRYL